MSEIERQLHSVDLSIEEAKRRVELAAALQRLHENKDFQKIILENYFTEESTRSVMLLSDVNTQDEHNQKQIQNVILGIGQLGQYFHKIFVFGEGAARAIEEDERTREELLQEQLQDETDLYEAATVN